MPYIRSSEERNQLIMISLEGTISQNAFVRVIDAFVDAIDLQSFGFTHTECKGCANRAKCTNGKRNGRAIDRSEYADAIERNNLSVIKNPDYCPLMVCKWKLSYIFE